MPAISKNDRFAKLVKSDDALAVEPETALMIGAMIAIQLTKGNWQQAAITLQRQKEIQERQQGTPTPQEILESSIQNIGLSMRLANGLEASGILTLEDLLNMEVAKIELIPNIGAMGIKMIIDTATIWKDWYERVKVQQSPLKFR